MNPLTCAITLGVAWAWPSSTVTEVGVSLKNGAWSLTSNTRTVTRAEAAPPQQTTSSRCCGEDVG